MKVRKTTWVTSENNPASIALAMIEAKVPGSAKVIEIKTGDTYTDFKSGRSAWSPNSAVVISSIQFLFEWHTDATGTVVPKYERKYIL